MSTRELLADLEARYEEDWRLRAEMRWESRQLKQMTAQLPPARTGRPAFPPDATVPPDAGSRLEALEDSVALLHTKLDTLIAQIAAWERGQSDISQA